MDGYFHMRGCRGFHHWRGFDPFYFDERMIDHAGHCRCGRELHAHYAMRGGRGIYSGEGVEVDKLDRVAFLEYEIKSLKNCLERSTGELERLKGEQNKGI